jgi:hypothetical protein
MPSHLLASVAGDVLHLTRAASVQFIRPISVRVIRELTDRHTYCGWTWIEAYQLNERGEATAKRELYVQRSGLRWLPPPTVTPLTSTSRRRSSARTRVAR